MSNDMPKQVDSNKAQVSSAKIIKQNVPDKKKLVKENVPDGGGLSKIGVPGNKGFTKRGVPLSGTMKREG
jgi:uncharacterized membrane protein